MSKSNTPDNRPDHNEADIRAQIAAEEKAAAAATVINRRKWWKNFAGVRMPKMGRRIIYGVLGAAAAYVAVGEFTNPVHNDPLKVTTPENGSAIVETFIQSMTRELNSGWCPASTYLFSPSHIRIDTCAFQEGKQEVYIRLAQDLQNHLTRQGYATRLDPLVSDIQQAFNRGNHWSPISWGDTGAQYWSGVSKLKTLQKNLVAGTAGDGEMHYRIENLAYLISDIASVVGSEQANISTNSDDWFGGWMAKRGDYYHALGAMSGSCEILGAMAQDFHEVLTLQSSTDIFKQAVDDACATQGETPLLTLALYRQGLFAKVTTLSYNLGQVQKSLAAQGISNGDILSRPSPRPAAPASVAHKP